MRLDLAITQKAATKMLDEPLAATDYEAVLSLSGVNSGLTRDRALLQEAIKKLKVPRPTAGKLGHGAGRLNMRYCRGDLRRDQNAHRRWGKNSEQLR